MTKDKILSQVSELVSDGARVGTRASKAHSPVSWLWLDRRELLDEVPEETRSSQMEAPDSSNMWV